MEESPQMEKMIIAFRGVYAAFNRGDIDAAVELLMLRSNGANLRVPGSWYIPRTRGGQAIP
jgi:hypothetical protein